MIWITHNIISLMQCWIVFLRGLPIRCPREHHATAKRAAWHQVQPGPAVPADFRRGVRPLSQHLRQRHLQPAVVSGGWDAAVLHQERQFTLGWRHPLRPQRDLPPRSVHVDPGCDGAAGETAVVMSSKHWLHEQQDGTLSRLGSSHFFALCTSAHGVPPIFLFTIVETNYVKKRKEVLGFCLILQC